MKITIGLKFHCFACGQIAKYDGKTKSGPWGYMCAECFKIHGVGLGLGKGQELVTLGEKK